MNSFSALFASTQNRTPVFVLTWYFTTVTSLLVSVLLLLSISTPKKLSVPNQPHYEVYKALPSMLQPTSDQTVQVTKKDARSDLVANFFRKYNAPLASNAQTFIEAADRYNLDYRLLPAIAMEESKGGQGTPAKTNNPFRYSTDNKKVNVYTSVGEAINQVAEIIKREYIDKGLKTPDEIMTLYAPSSIKTGGTWALNVSKYLKQLN